jgi:hypothetical protein
MSNDEKRKRRMTEQTRWEERRDRSVEGLIANARSLRATLMDAPASVAQSSSTGAPMTNAQMLEYLTDYCRSAWRKGWEARDRDAKRDARKT